MPKTIEELRQMCQREQVERLSDRLSERSLENWKYYAGQQFDTTTLKRFQDLDVIPMALNETAAAIDSYTANIDPDSLEPVVTATEAQSSYLEEIGTAMLRWGRNQTKLGRIEKEQLRYLFVQGATGVFVEVVSEFGRTKWRIEKLFPSEIRWDDRATEANLTDTVWRARVMRKTKRELKLEYPEWWRAIKEEWGDTSEIPNGQSLFSSYNRAAPLTSVEVVLVEWRERHVCLRVVAPDPVDQEAARLLGLEIDISGGIRLYGDSQEEFVDLVAELGGNPDLRARAERIEGDCFYYAIVVGDVVVEQGRLPENRFRIVLCTGPTVLVYEEGTDYRSIVGDIRAPQDLLNRALSLQLRVIGASAKAGLAVSRTETDLETIEQRYGKPGAVIRMDDPNNMKELKTDPSVLQPGMALISLAKQVIDSRLGSNSYSRGGAGASGDLRRVSGDTVEQLLDRADAPVKGYIELFVDWRVMVAELMVAQLIYFPFEEMIRILGPDLVAPLYQAFPGMDRIPSDAAVDVKIDLKEPGKQADAQIAAQVISQGLLPQFQQLGIMPPPNLLFKILAPVISNLNKDELREWEAYVVQQQQMAQQQAQMQSQPSGEEDAGMVQ